MKPSIKRSELLAFPSDKALPAFEANELRDYDGKGPVQVWLAQDGCAACCMYPAQSEASFSSDVEEPGNWFIVELDAPETIESVNEMAARAWLERFLKL